MSATQNALRSNPTNIEMLAQRLKYARERAGFDTAADFARAHGINHVTYQHHENGNRGVRYRSIQQYAHILGIDPAVLLFGKGLPKFPWMVISGFVGNAGKVRPLINDIDQSAPETCVPDLETLVVYRIEGDQLQPRYSHGDELFHRSLSADRYNPERCDGHECMVQLSNGDMLVRYVYRQMNGRVALQFPGIDDQINVEIRAAEPIEMVKRSLSPRATNR